MNLEHFIDEAVSPWMHEEGPDSDIVLSSRIRLARNFTNTTFPIIAKEEELEHILEFFKEHYATRSFQQYKDFEFIPINDLSRIEKRLLVEKHLISPYMIKHVRPSAVMISKNEQVSIMVNEEDHIRLQMYLPGFQLEETLQRANELDDWLEEHIDYAFDEKRGYLTSCPTNVGTGMRASVMMHLPALVLTRQINHMIPAINQVGLVVRGIYGEGSEAIGNLFQVSNQITLGKSESDIVEDLGSIVQQLIKQEKRARATLVEQTGMRLEDKVFRSYGTLKYSRILESKEAARCLSNVRLGIDLQMIKGISGQILNELMILTQPGFLQKYAERILTPQERDILRAELIRERLNMEEK
ncbi:MAG TPA: protein arginine kinase [Candidatus Avamphibacillus intestinigallinarum]|nr:protein arginine kinase [Candidatus Avamphibacillus intestinigallinarum]